MPEWIQNGKGLAATEILLTAALLLVMAHRGLAGTYRIFLAFMAVKSVDSVIFIVLNPATNRYAYAYLAANPILWVFSILVVLELYENVLADFPGIVSFGKWVITGTFAIAVCISLLTARYDWNVSAHPLSPVLFYYTFIERGVTTSQVLFLLLMTVFLRWFPAPLQRNVHVHTVILFFYFLIESSLLLFRNLVGEQVTMPVNLAILGASCLCVIGWIWQLSPKLADRKITYRKVDMEEENRILGGLRAVNDTLLGAAKR